MKKGPFIALLVIVVIILGVVITIGLIYLNLTAEPPIPQQTYLQIDVSGSIKESYGGFALGFGDGLTVQDLWYQVERACRDSRIKGLVMKISDVDAGFAKLRELGLLMRLFRTYRKPVVAFIETGGLRELYLATFADKVFLFKGGYFNFCGPAAEAVFFKNTLSKLGIQAEVFHTGNYKTASNVYTEERMTPAHRESMEKLINDIYGTVTDEIAANRLLDPGEVRSVLNESPLPKDVYLQKKMVDRIGYFDEIYQVLPARYPVTSFKTYSRTTSSPPFVGSKKVAVIFASGEINPGHSGGQSITGSDTMGADTIAEYLRNARNNYEIKAVVLRVDSPGGSAVASDVILREAELLAQKKPLVISMSDLAASGGYWISLSSSRIFAHPQTITGSIGVISGKFVLKGLYDKIGITKEFVKTTKYSGMLSDYTPFTNEEKAKIVGDMEDFYREFLRKVAAGRKLDVASVERIAQGRVWSGQSALGLKLVDGFGGLDDAIGEARKLAHIYPGEPMGLRMYPVKKTLLDLIFQLTGAEVRSPVLDIQARLRMAQTYFPALALPFQVRIR